jgi:hypothetical protein
VKISFRPARAVSANRSGLSFLPVSREHRLTIELFAEHLGELREIFGKDVLPTLHARRIAELTGAADGLFGNVEDTIR